jgi:hypothetical protein
MEKKLLGARIDSDLARQVKTASASSGKKMADWISDALRAALLKKGKPV